MPAAYSLELRQRVVDLYKKGKHTQPEVAAIYQIGLTTVRDYLKRDAEDNLAPDVYKPGRTAIIHEKGLIQIQKWIEKKPHITLKKLCSRYYQRYGKKVNHSMMWRACKELGLSYKKKTIHASEQTDEEIKRPTPIGRK